MMNKTDLIVMATKLDIEVNSATKKETLIELIAEKLTEKKDTTALVEFLEQNGFTLEKGKVVKLKKKPSLGRNPGTKAFFTIEVLSDPNLAHLSIDDIVEYLKQSHGITTTKNCVSWYINFMRNDPEFKDKLIERKAKAKPVEEEV